MPFDLLGSLSRGEDHPYGESESHQDERQVAAAGDGQNVDAVQCSRRGCRDAASWLLEWNNPRVHTPDRRKTWAACDEHRAHLAAFLTERGFLKAVRPLEPESSTVAKEQSGDQSPESRPTGDQPTGDEQ